MSTRPKAICVYCASSDRLDKKYYDLATELGRLLGRGGHRLVYGGGNVGMMGAVARATKEHGGQVTGVIPRFMVAKELEFTEADERLHVDTMRERKQHMEHRADAFIALPGGWGTLEEILEIITLRQLDVVRKPCIFVNLDGFYDPLFALFRRMVGEHFNRPSNLELFECANSAAEALALALDERPRHAESKWFITK